jgi:hypothetical protein
MFLTVNNAVDIIQNVVEHLVQPCISLFFASLLTGFLMLFGFVTASLTAIPISHSISVNRTPRDTPHPASPFSTHRTTIFPSCHVNELLCSLSPESTVFTIPLSSLM